MTDTLNETQQSGTGYRTPETDAYRWSDDRSIYGWSEFAGKLERERDKAEERAKELEAEVQLWKENATSNRDVFDETVKNYDDLTEKFIALEREHNKAVTTCKIWQHGHSKLVADRDEWQRRANEHAKNYLAMCKEAEHAKSYKKVMKEQHKQLTEKLASVVKQNAKLLTMLQEHGLAEYGN